MTSLEQSIIYTEEDKLHLEVEKLSEEVRVLKHPFSQPALWFATIALLLSVISNIWQFYTSENKRVLAEILTKSATLELEQVNRDREAMEQKRDMAKNELEKMQTDLGKIKEQFSSIKQTAVSPLTQQKLDQAETLITNLETKTEKVTVNLEKSESPSTQKFRNNLQLAKEKEREGFQNLISGNYPQAIAAFQAAENAYPTYDNVYELARLIKENQSQLNDPVKKREIFKKIVDQYSYGAPPDLLRQIAEVAGKPSMPAK